MRFLYLLPAAACLLAQEPPAPEPAKPKRLPEPKNLQILKVAPAELISIMRGYNAALGVQCTFCHVQGNFAADDKNHKVIARKMIAMNQEINAKLAGAEAGASSADAKVFVSCYTCHRGEAHPQVNPPAQATGAGSGAPGAAPPPPPPPPPPAQP